MTKLFNAFVTRTHDERTKQRLIAHIRKHPMSVCILCADEIAFLREHGIL